MSLPLVSIVIPVFNHENYINDCIDSCLAQTYPNIEIIVVDDGSTDTTPILLKKYGNKINVITQKNQGAASALNNGFEQAKGEYIAWLSSDDAYFPEKIAKQVKFFAEHSTFDVLYTSALHIDSNGDVISEEKSKWFPPDEFFFEILKGNFINGTSILMKRKVWEIMDGFNENIPAVVDGDMWFRLLESRYKFGFVSETLVKYRIHQKSQTSNRTLMIKYSDIVHSDCIKRVNPDILFPNLQSNSEKIKLYGDLSRILFNRKNFQSSLECHRQMELLGDKSLKNKLKLLFIPVLNSKTFIKLYYKYLNFKSSRIQY